MTSENRPKRIYLDTRDWIILARVVNGIEKDPELVEVYEKIKRLSDSEAAIFPISFFHLEDMMIHSNEERRNKLIEFMISISKGWVIKPYTFYTNKEIANAVLRRLGAESIHDIRSEILAKGLAYLVSSEYMLRWNKSANVPENFEELLRNEIDKPESFIMLLKDTKIVDRFMQFKQETERVAKSMETNRKQRLVLNKEQRYATAVTSYLNDVVIDRLADILSVMDRSTRTKVIPTSKQDIEQFLEDMPSTNIVFRLTYARDQFYERSVEPNDVADINHLTVSIPYCDIVVMERMFGSASLQLGLDKKYGCTILRSLKELNKII